MRRGEYYLVHNTVNGVDEINELVKVIDFDGAYAVVESIALHNHYALLDPQGIQLRHNHTLIPDPVVISEKEEFLLKFGTLPEVFKELTITHNLRFSNDGIY